MDLEGASSTVTNNRVIAAGGIDEKDTKTATSNRTFRSTTRPSQRCAHGISPSGPSICALGIRPEGEYVFTGVEGGPLGPQGDDTVHEASHAARPARIRGVQGLRHSAVTWLVGRRSKRSATHRCRLVTMMRNYAHVAPAQDRELAEAFATAIDAESRDNP